MDQTLYVTSLMFPLMLLFDESANVINPAEEKQFNDYLGAVLQTVNFQYLEKLSFLKPLDLQLMKAVFEMAELRKFAYLQLLAFNFPIDAEEFIVLFNKKTVKNLRTMDLKLVIPGDAGKDYFT